MLEQNNLKQNVDFLQEALLQLERRVSVVERSLGVRGDVQGDVPLALEKKKVTQSADEIDEADLALEVQIGELWVGHAGVVALLIGAGFFVSYPFGFPAFVQSLVGYLVIAGLLWVSQRWQHAYPSIARTLFTGSLLLFYFTTLRLHFFTSVPLIAQKELGLALIVVVVGSIFYLAFRQQSLSLLMMAILLGMATSLFSDTTHFALILIVAVSAGGVFLRFRLGWQSGVLVCLCLAYITHLVLLFNNPIMGHPRQVLVEHQGHLVYLFVYATVFGLANLPKRQTSDSGFYNIVLTLVNGTGFFAVGSLIAHAHFKGHLAGIHLIFSAFFLILASAYWVYRESRFSTAFYACFGYVALSIALVSYFESPARFLWLGWQSLLVICMAIWFRSRIVVSANVLIYLGIFFYYLILTPPDLLVSLSYAAVALLSARVMNWQKERLTLKTEALRNIYLTSAFVILPYAMYHGMPGNYVSVSWLGIALFYFALSLALHNRKYRWMAILTLFLTVIYVFLVDLAKLNPAFRMVSFLIGGATMLGVSWMYARYHRAHDKEMILKP